MSGMYVLAFGTYDTSVHPRVGTVLEGLRALGDDVLEANVPLGYSTAQRIAFVRRPWGAYRLALRVLASWAVLVTRAWRLRHHGVPDAVVVGYLAHFDVFLARALFPKAKIVFDMLIFAEDTATDRRVRSGPKLRLLRVLDRAAAAASDVIMLDTEEQRALLPASQRRKVVVVPVGSPSRWFCTQTTGRPPEDQLRVVFFGLYTPLQGTVTVGEALAELAGREDIVVTMVGIGQDRERAQAAAATNRCVRWIDWLPAAELAATVAAHDVCLGVFGTTPKARRVVPNKIYQGAAAGCALVTSDTPPQRRALGNAAIYVPAGDSTALAAALRRLADNRATVTSLREAALARARTEFAPGSVVAGLRDRLATLTKT